MDRTAATAYLTQMFRELSADAKFTSQQITDAYSNAIDMSLRYLGFDEADLATADVQQSDTLKYIALLDYFALERFSTLLSIRFDVTFPAQLGAKRSQEFSQVQTLLNRAENKLASLGINIGANGDAVQFGRINLDYLEPRAAGSNF